jgi:hypothetical protein
MPDLSDQNYSLNVNQGSPGSINVSDASGNMDEADVKYRSGNQMIVEYHDPQTGERVLVQMEKK